MMRVLVAVLLVVAACGDKSPPPTTPGPAEPATPSEPASPGDEVLVLMDAFKVKVCACKNSTCVEQVDEEMTKWAMANMEKYKDIKPTPAQETRADKISKEMDACRETVAAASELPPSTVADVLDRMASFRDRMCACKDQVCAEFAEKEVKDWLEANAGAMATIKPSKAEGETAAKIDGEMTACRAKLAGE